MHNPGSLWLGVVTSDKGPIYGLNRTKQWFLDFIFIFEFKLRV